MTQITISKKVFSDICDCCESEISYSPSDIGLGNLVQCSNCECERFPCAFCMAGSNGDCSAAADDGEEICISAIDAACEAHEREVVSV